ncbi:hypothetical protein lbkm_1411 [Lachnospiraceae bacterium KM106-2]|nr:hypothetical protein lbkm_1411 [Lachnospiraceae bacterium KM106-2]
MRIFVLVIIAVIQGYGIYVNGVKHRYYEENPALFQYLLYDPSKVKHHLRILSLAILSNVMATIYFVSLFLALEQFDCVCLCLLTLFSFLASMLLCITLVIKWIRSVC